MTINIDSETKVNFDFDFKSIVVKAIEGTVAYVNCPYEVEVNILLVDNESIRMINHDNRNIDRPTDVLSFPMIEYEVPGDFSVIDEEKASEFNPDTGELMLGDVVISVEKVSSQAIEYGHSEIRELAFLTVHSMLHLFGYDHMDEEDKTMENIQREILDKINITR